MFVHQFSILSAGTVPFGLVTSIPIETAALMPGDDIVEVAATALAAAGLTPLPTDILVIRGVSLAIAQGRIVPVDALKPGLAARVFCRLFRTNGSLGSPYAMQTAIDMAGRARIAVALAAELAGHLVGRRGDFYRLAGRQLGWIRDVSGPMPPHSQDIILGPDEPRGVAARMSEALGCGAAVVDADDRGNVEIMGASAFLDRDRLTEAMRDPQCTDHEQTPLVLVRA